MSLISLTLPTSGVTLNNLADPELVTALTTIQTAINGGIDAVNLSAALQASVGANSGGQISKGATNIVATETRTNVAYGTLTTPDQVTGIVLPAAGLLQVWYQATWQNSAASGPGNGRAAIFLGANQVISGVDGGAQRPGQETSGPQTINQDGQLSSFGGGLVATANQNWVGDVATGQIVGWLSANPATLPSSGLGGPCTIFAAAGTYTVSVQFKSSSGSVTVKNRRLYVQALSFA